MIHAALWLAAALFLLWFGCIACVLLAGIGIWIVAAFVEVMEWFWSGCCRVVGALTYAVQWLWHKGWQ